jgi:hypothetical protein
MKIKVYNPVLCKTPHRQIIIYDARGVLFYDSTWSNNFKGVFSLPKGEYFSDYTFKVVRRLSRKRIKLLKPERNKKHNWSDFKILFASNPNKCTIDHIKKLIVFDDSFKDKPQYQLIFILLHEKGHNFYKTEHKADWFAVRGMWMRGYNKSQIGLAPLLTLSEKSNYRKKKVINYLIKNL